MSQAAVSLEAYLTAVEDDEGSGFQEEADLEEQLAREKLRQARSRFVARFKEYRSNYGLERAACIGLVSGDNSPVDFHPEEGFENPAKLVCNRCPDQDKCLAVAMETGQKDGVWGGSTPKERRNIKRNHTRNANSLGSEPLGAFAVRMRGKYIKPADELGPFDSRRPSFTRVEADALCLNEESDLFEMLDSGHTDGFAGEMLDEAKEICRDCPNYGLGCADITPPADFAVTVFGGAVKNMQRVAV